MQDLRHILVPTDFSKDASNALIYAVNIAQQLNVKLFVLHVKEETENSNGSLTDEAIQDKFEQTKHDYLFSRNLGVEFLTRSGNIVENIRQIADELRIDLIVLGMKGAGSKREAMFGSITAELMDNPVCSMISVPSDCRILAVDNIAIASDYQSLPNPPEMYALSYISEAFNSKVHIFHVKEKEEAVLAEEVKGGFDELFQYNLHSFQDVSGETVISAIKSFATENNIDLLTVFHRINIQDHLKRSISKQLAFSTQLPLLVIPVK